MSEYLNISDRLTRIKKSLEEEKRDKNTPNEIEDTHSYEPENNGAAYAIKQLISFNCRRELANESKDVLDEELGFPQYVNALNSFKNPDILTGGSRRFLKGNHYRAKMVNKHEDEIEEREKLDNDESKEEGQEESSESDDESSGDPDIPSRYYHGESKGIRCHNCKEIGHMARNCPNESRVPLCKFCGTQHGLSDMCPAIKCFKCNKSGHKVSDCTSSDMVRCSKCQTIGHTAKRCLMTAFNGKTKYVLCVVCHKPGHLNCLDADRHEYHIDFNEEEVEESDEDNLFGSYTIKDLNRDEKTWRKQQKNMEVEMESYEEYDGVGVNIVNSKQMKKFKMQSYHHDHIPRHLKKFYTFPIEDIGCTESQLEVRYCGNCGRKGHHFADCEYEENPLFINYQRKTFRRDKINKEQLNRSKYSERNNDSRSRHENRDWRGHQTDRHHDNSHYERSSFDKSGDRYSSNNSRQERKPSLLDRIVKAGREKSPPKNLHMKERRREAKENKKLYSSRDFLDIGDEIINIDSYQTEEVTEKAQINNRKNRKLRAIERNRTYKQSRRYSENAERKEDYSSFENEVRANQQPESNITDNLFTIGDDELSPMDAPVYHNQAPHKKNKHHNKKHKNAEKIDAFRRDPNKKSDRRSSEKKKSGKKNKPKKQGKHKQLKQDWVNDKWEKDKQSRKGRNNSKKRKQYQD